MDRDEQSCGGDRKRKAAPFSVKETMKEDDSGHSIHVAWYLLPSVCTSVKWGLMLSQMHKYKSCRVMETACTLSLALISTLPSASLLFSESGVHTLILFRVTPKHSPTLLSHPHRSLAQAPAFCQTSALDHTWPEHIPAVPGDSAECSLHAEAGRR